MSRRCSKVIQEFRLISHAISFDVGGTSTDVSRYDGRYEIVYETTTAGISIQSPQLDINTVSVSARSHRGPHTEDSACSYRSQPAVAHV